MNLLHDLAARVGHAEQLDVVGDSLADAVHRVIPPQSRIKDLASGTWLGHPLHPLLTDIPIGSFTSATVLDLVGGVRSQPAANGLVALGLASSVVAAAAGAADWSDTAGEDKRIGVVHAASNAVGVALYGASFVARRRGRRGLAASLGLAGMSVMSVGGFLGGHLTFSRGIGINANFDEHPPSEWSRTVDLEAVGDAAMAGVEVEGSPVLLHRRRGAMHAIANRCSHAGGPLDEGTLDPLACTVTCPWHQSVFRTDTGEVVHGPATVPQPALDTRVVDGHVEVRARSTRRK